MHIPVMPCSRTKFPPLTIDEWGSWDDVRNWLSRRGWCMISGDRLYYGGPEWKITASSDFSRNYVLVTAEGTMPMVQMVFENAGLSPLIRKKAGL